MTEKQSQNQFVENPLSVRLSKLEYSVQLLNNKLNLKIPPELHDRLISAEKNIPPNLSSRITIIEQKIENFEDKLSEEKGRWKERLAFIAVIITLVITLVSGRI